MSSTLVRVQELTQQGAVRISLHGYDELAEDEISVRDVLDGATDAIEIEDYPDYSKGPCVLVLQRDGNGESIHILWGIPRNAQSPAVLVTGYRPDARRWMDGFTRRKP